MVPLELNARQIQATQINVLKIKKYFHTFDNTNPSIEKTALPTSQDTKDLTTRVSIFIKKRLRYCYQRTLKSCWNLSLIA